MPTYATNRDARHDYTILETLEAGIVLIGAEVKAVKSGNVSLKGSYASINGNELWLINAHIGRYQPAGLQPNYVPTRSRRLLVRRADIDSLVGKTKSTGQTLVPLSVYSKHGLIKVELGLARGKKAYDKRTAMKKRDTERKIGRAMRVKE